MCHLQNESVNVLALLLADLFNNLVEPFIINSFQLAIVDSGKVGKHDAFKVAHCQTENKRRLKKRNLFSLKLLPPAERLKGFRRQVQIFLLIVAVQLVEASIWSVQVVLETGLQSLQLPIYVHYMAVRNQLTLSLLWLFCSILNGMHD